MLPGAHGSTSTNQEAPRDVPRPPYVAHTRGTPMTPELTTDPLSDGSATIVPDRGNARADVAEVPEEDRTTTTTTTTTTPVVDVATTEHAVVAVIGLGYVGLPTAIALRNAGCRIIGIDISPMRLDAIRDGQAVLLPAEHE